MQTRRRIDITPEPAQFDYHAAPERDHGITATELLVGLVALSALLVVVVEVQDAMSRLAGVLLITGALAAFLAQRVFAARSHS